jgi:hypothetical protein
MTFWRHAKYQYSGRHIIIGLIVAAALACICFLFREPLLLVARPSYWTQLLSDRGPASTIIAGFAGGFLTICAGLLTVFFYSHQQRDTNWCNFLKWLTEFHIYFHKEAKFAEVRIKLADNRRWIRQQLTCELLEDKMITEADVVEVDKPALCPAERKRDVSPDWPFLCVFTDYLYFFEQILIFGETLYHVNRTGNSFVLVDHFGWFLRSLCNSWDEGTGGTESWKAKRLFVLYLAHSRYLRMASVSLVFLTAGRPENDGAASSLFSEARKILAIQGQELRGWSSLEDLQEYWLPIVGPAGTVAH